jgi:hypothetical protein
MFTRRELIVLHDALVYYVEKHESGQYYISRLSLVAAQNLTKRFEEILNDYSDMENKYGLELAETPFACSK